VAEVVNDDTNAGLHQNGSNCLEPVHCRDPAALSVSSSFYGRLRKPCSAITANKSDWPDQIALRWLRELIICTGPCPCLWPLPPRGLGLLHCAITHAVKGLPVGLLDNRYESIRRTCGPGAASESMLQHTIARHWHQNPSWIPARDWPLAQGRCGSTSNIWKCRW